MGRTLNEDDVLKEIDRWIGYLDEDMITRIKISIKKIPSAQSEMQDDGELDFVQKHKKIPVELRVSAQQEPEHTMEEFMYGQDLGSPEDGSL